MEFKNLPMKVQMILIMMHGVGIIEAMCQGQNMTQDQFQNAVVESFAALGIDQNYMNDLLESLTAEENRLMEEYMEDQELDVVDEDEDEQDSPKVH